MTGYIRYKINYVMKGKNVTDYIFLPPHYIPQTVIGSGAFGAVFRALDTRTNEQIAIKKVSGYNLLGEGCFQSLGMAKRMLREVKILKHFAESGHPNVLRIRDIISPQSYETFDNIFIVTDLYPASLEDLIFTSQLTPNHHRVILLQLLRGLSYLHSGGVFHRDLKPANLVVGRNSEAAIIDFGLARSTSGHALTMFKTPGHRVVTRAYRSPELLLGATQYGPAVDVWSVGILMLEMLSKQIVFRGTGDDALQLLKIAEKFGKITPAHFGATFSDKMKRNLETLSAEMDKITPHGLDSLLPDSCPPDAADLLSKMLQINPSDRISVEDALKHPYVTTVESLFPMPAVAKPTPMRFVFEEQSASHSIPQLKALIYDEIRYFHPELPARPDLHLIPAIIDSLPATASMESSGGAAASSSCAAVEAAASSDDSSSPGSEERAKRSEDAILIPDTPQSGPQDMEFSPSLPGEGRQ